MPVKKSRILSRLVGTAVTRARLPARAARAKPPFASLEPDMTAQPATVSKANFDRPESDPSFPTLEHEILALWEKHDVFKRSIRGDKEFVFFDGPPFATGTPHYGHLLAGTLKDIVPRYWAMRGYRVERRFGWDTHGLPVEMEIEKKLNLSGPSAIDAFGIDNYNEACRSIVLRYTSEWRNVLTRMNS